MDMGCMWIRAHVRHSAGPDLSDLVFDEKPLQCLKGKEESSRVPITCD